MEREDGRQRGHVIAGRRGRTGAVALVALAAVAVTACAGPVWSQARTPSEAPADARVFFVDLVDGAVLPPKSRIRFGLSGMTIAPAGTNRAGSGHHHLLIDAEMPPADQPVPADFNHLHFGAGQTEADISLPPGEHTLQLLFADHDHVPHRPVVASQKIKVKVVDPTAAPAEGVAGGPPRSKAPSGAKVAFVGLADGAVIPSKSVIRFEATGIATVPAGVERPDAGHHHLLIDTPLPPLDHEIPADFNHVHFGKGQTEFELNLPPGEHTLQLLFADHQHVPHDPPVMSERIKVRVTAAAGAAQVTRGGRKPSPPDAAVYFIYPRNGETIYPNTTVRFGLRNMGVAPAGVARENTGHHHLIVDAETPPLDTAIPADFNHIHLGGGQTERRISLKPGTHTLQLVLADENHVPHDPPVVSERITVKVMAPAKRRRGGR